MYAWPLPHLAALLVVGILLWQLLEYLIHRFAFHAHLSSYWGITLHFLFHGCHHKYPLDSLRLVMPPLPALAAHLLVYTALSLAFPLHMALPLFAGAGFGYVAYDCLHYAIHHCKEGRGLAAFSWLRALRRNHLYHHFKNGKSGFGISSPLWDIVFRTS
jgi:dihydroceramide fatty acyl 2-hydroxylase